MIIMYLSKEILLVLKNKHLKSFLRCILYKLFENSIKPDTCSIENSVNPDHLASSEAIFTAVSS